MPFFFVIIQYSVYEINARAAKFHIKVLCLFLHSVLDRDRERERESKSIKCKECRKLIIFEEVHYIHLNTDIHYARKKKTLPVE